MAFTKCWLAYPEIRGCHCDAISLHTELTGETIDRAKAELAEGFKGLYGAALTEGDDITGSSTNTPPWRWTWPWTLRVTA